jgi:predicted short-subunit dehydrogenase-like oxidoreductase (DUF2520 family)
MKRDVCVWGTGKVGTAFAQRLVESGYQIMAGLDADTLNEERFARRFQCRRASELSKPICCSMVLCSLPDTVLRQANISRQFEELFTAEMLFHTSGSLPASVFSLSANTETLSIHPLISMPTLKAALSRFAKAYFAVEGLRPEWGLKLLKKLNLQGFIVTETEKLLYHTAAVLAGNLLSAPLFAAGQAAEAAAIQEADFRSRFMPLMQSVLDNLADEGFSNILSGPVKRKDLALMQQQTEALKFAGLTDESQLYEALRYYLEKKVGLI